MLARSLAHPLFLTHVMSRVVPAGQLECPEANNSVIRTSQMTHAFADQRHTGPSCQAENVKNVPRLNSFPVTAVLSPICCRGRRRFHSILRAQLECESPALSSRAMELEGAQNIPSPRERYVPRLPGILGTPSVYLSEFRQSDSDKILARN